MDGWMDLGQKEQEDGQFLPGLLLPAETPVSFAIDSSRYRLREVNRSILQESCMYLAHSGCRRPDQNYSSLLSLVPGIVRPLSSLTELISTILLRIRITLYSALHSPASKTHASQPAPNKTRHSTYLIPVGGSYGQYPTPFRPANHPLAHALAHLSPPPSDPPESPAHLAPQHLVRYVLQVVVYPCTALPCLASPRLSTLSAAHLTLLRSTPYGTKYQ